MGTEGRRLKLGPSTQQGSLEFSLRFATFRS